MKRFRDDERGASSIEYALICMLIFLVIVGAVRGVSTQVSSQYNSIATGIGSAR